VLTGSLRTSAARTRSNEHNRERFRESAQVCDEILSLPMFPEIWADPIERAAHKALALGSSSQQMLSSGPSANRGPARSRRESTEASGCSMVLGAYLTMKGPGTRS
jgi:hypothetical protein